MLAETIKQLFYENDNNDNNNNIVRPIIAMKPKVYEVVAIVGLILSIATSVLLCFGIYAIVITAPTPTSFFTLIVFSYSVTSVLTSIGAVIFSIGALEIHTVFQPDSVEAIHLFLPGTWLPIIYYLANGLFDKNKYLKKKLSKPYFIKITSIIEPDLDSNEIVYKNVSFSVVDKFFDIIFTVGGFKRIHKMVEKDYETVLSSIKNYGSEKYAQRKEQETERIEKERSEIVISE